MSESMINLTVAGISALSAIVGALIGGAVSYFVAKFQFRAATVAANRQIWINTLRDAIAELQSCLNMLPLIQENKPALEKAQMLRFRISLMLNVNELHHAKLEDLLVATFKTVLSSLTKNQLPDLGEINQQVVETSRVLLKAEWEKVKSAQ
jgi:hypothetical protein